jgi:hypothetical protein
MSDTQEIKLNPKTVDFRCKNVIVQADGVQYNVYFDGREAPFLIQSMTIELVAGQLPEITMTIYPKEAEIRKHGKTRGAVMGKFK